VATPSSRGSGEEAGVLLVSLVLVGEEVVVVARDVVEMMNPEMFLAVSLLGVEKVGEGVDVSACELLSTGARDGSG